MTKSTKKSTRKFQKNHLKTALEKRKASRPIKHRLLVKQKRQAKLAREADASGNTADGSSAQDGEDGAEEGDAFGKMTMDDFFQGGFEIPEKAGKKSKKSTKEKLGKRKRVEAEEDREEDDESDSSGNESFEDQPMADDDEEGSEDEEEEGMDQDALDALAQKDPEFYKYLKENDPEALEFDANADFAEVDELSESEVDERPKKKKKTKASKDDDEEEVEEEPSDETEVTQALLKKWEKAMEDQKSFRAMRQVVLAFRAAAHINEEDDKEYKYTISNPEVYHHLLIAALKHVPEVLQHHLPIKETAVGKIRVAMDSKKFKTLTPLLKSHIVSIQHLLTSLSDTKTLNVTLSSITALLPYLLSFKKIMKSLTKTVVDIWSDNSSSEATRITAFLCIRRLTVIGDAGLREMVLKSIYQGLVKGSRQTTAHTIQGINLMKNSAAELWGIDQNVGYTTGFAFIRQLAIHLRSSITNKTKESYKTVYNWQYVHSLDFWSVVLSEHCSPLKEALAGKESDLRPLIYPTVQVTLGAMRLIPTAAYFPLRFHLIRSLLRLSRATQTYIPLASAILEVLNSAEMKKPPIPSTLKSLDFSLNYKAQKAYLRTRVYQDGVGEQLVELFSEFFFLWSTSIAFPELALPVVVMLKRWLKAANNKTSGNRNNKVNSGIAIMVQKLEANGKWIEEKRAKVDFAPNDRAGVEGFLKGFEREKTPLGAYVASQRTQRAEKAKMLEAARKEEEKKRQEEKEDKQRGNDEDSDEDDEEGEEDSNEE